MDIQSQISHFRAKQAKIVADASKERKRLEEERRKQNERDYWADVRDQEDKMADGSDYQPYEEVE